ncbi:hypothetical protein DSM112329_01126 [Paraconexibacter sp. AEG42_29]|uniref:SSD domain-containing protein n=1 Tax=Paraconexibacter sp. AEG42_29 TaxID=2997339 RepID=A0AAU7ARQ2_9ACTN
MRRVTALATQHRRLVVTAWLVLTVAGGWAAGSINDVLSRSFDAPGRPAFQANREIARDFGNGGQVAPVVLVARRAGDASSARMQRSLAQVAERVGKAVPGSRVLTAGDRGGRDDRAAQGDRDTDGLVARDGRSAVALVFPPLGRPAPDENPAALSAARRVVGESAAPGVRISVTGIEALADDTGSGGGPGLLIETLGGGIGALIVLGLVFASALALVPIAIAACSILTTFVLLRLLTEVTDVSFVVQFLVGLIGLGVAIDYSLLIVVRWREERAHGHDNATAVATAMRTAGHSVAVSGLTVAIGLLALVVVPVPFIRSIGYGGLLIPLVSVAAALTLLPALLSAFGPRLDRRRGDQDHDPGERWTAWATFVVRRRWPAAVAGLLVLGALALVATDLRPGRPSVDALSAGGQARSTLEALERSGIGSGALTPVELVSDGPLTPSDRRRAAAVPGVSAVISPAAESWSAGGRSLSLVVLRDDASGDGRPALDRLRDADLDARVGGPDAQDRDLSDAIYASFPLMVALIALITFALLARALNSILLPLKAILLNVLSVGASFGVVVLVWQQGHGSELIGGVPSTGSITGWVPLAIFAFLYGLSMDYEVFILARMREEYERTGSTDEAVIAGLGRTGRLVTSAALILFLAFAALAATPNTEIRILATGLAAGILLDATVVRALVVPALVTLFGRANWWAPWNRGAPVGQSGGPSR